MLLSDDEIAVLVAKFHNEPIELEDLFREAVRLTAERCAEICEEHSRAHTYASENADCYRIQNEWALVCAAAIRERAKSEPA